jgi:hypothetical protein
MNKLSNFIRRCLTVRQHYEQDERLLRRIHRHYTRLLKNIGNRRQVEKESKITLQLINKLKNVPLYVFIQDDITKIKNTIHKIKKNPKQHKLKYVLASAYMVSPGTFEATGIFLFLRYSWKYVLHYRDKKASR